MRNLPAKTGKRRMPPDNGKDGLAYSALLKNELLGAGIEKVQDPQTEDRRLQPSTPERKGLFTYSLSTKRSSPDDGNDVSPYSLSPLATKSEVTAVATETHPQDLQDPLQGPGRA